jgi:uncharacterized protein
MSSVSTIRVRVHTRSQKPRVVEEEDVYQVYVSSAPEKGKANKEVVRTLAKHLGVSRSSITIVSGLTSREKTVKIDSGG